MKSEELKATKSGGTPTFDEFWEAYPLHRGRIEAERAWKRLTTGQKALAIAALPAYTSDCQKNGISYKYAQGWLNGHRWEDNLQEDVTAPKTKDAGTPPPQQAETPSDKYKEAIASMREQLRQAWSRHKDNDRDCRILYGILLDLTVEDVNEERKIVCLKAGGRSLSREFAIPYYWDPSDFDRIVAEHFGGYSWTDNKYW